MTLREDTIRQRVQCLILSGIALTSVMLLPGCDSARKDVRVSFCRTLVLTQLPSGSTPSWTGETLDPKGFEGLSVRLRYQASSTGEARCYYPYRAADTTDMSLADPLANYGTSPTRMWMNGRELSREALARAIKDAVVLQAKGLWKHLSEAVDSIGEK